MKTLKKTLCLVLALVMVIGMFAVSANAAYTDQDKITAKYDVAIGVLTGLGILEGSDGAFNPQGVLTRGGACKIITYAMIGKDAADSLSKNVSPFVDVAAGTWYAGYISYCKNIGIIAGDDVGTFRPDDYISVIGFAKMCLTAAGYGREAEYEGAGYEDAVRLDATIMDVFKGDLAAIDAGTLTRELAAQMLYNTMSYTEVVKYNNRTGVYADVAGTLFANNYGYENAAPVEDVQVTGVTYTEDDGFMAQNADTAFVTDDYAIAGNVYDLYKDAEGEVVYAKLVSTTSVAAADQPGTDLNDYKVFAGNVYTESDEAYEKGDVLIKVGTEIFGILRDSTTEVEVVVDYTAATDDDAAFYEVSIGGDLYISTEEDAELNLVAEKIDWLSFVADLDEDEADIDAGYWYADTLYYDDDQDGYVITLTAADEVTGEVTRIKEGTPNEITVGGKVYEIDALGDIEIGAEVALVIALDGKTVLEGEVVSEVVDPYAGYELALVNTQVETVYSFNTATGSTDETNTYYVDVVFADGTYATYNYATLNGKKVVTSVTDGTKQVQFDDIVNTLVMVKVDGEDAAIKSELPETYATETTSEEVAKTTKYLDGTASAKWYVNAATKFIYADYVDVDEDVDTPDELVVTLKKGAHDYIGDVATGVIVIVPVESGVQYIDTVFYFDSLEEDDDPTVLDDVYYVTDYEGLSADGYEYTAYKLGETKSVILAVEGDGIVDGDGYEEGFYQLVENVDEDGELFYTLSEVDPTDIYADVLELDVDVFEIDGVYYADDEATAAFAADVVIVDLRDTEADDYEAVKSVADLKAEMGFIYVLNAEAYEATTPATVIDYIFLVDLV